MAFHHNVLVDGVFGLGMQSLSCLSTWLLGMLGKQGFGYVGIKMPLWACGLFLVILLPT
jgi:hypothetical protein